MNFIAQDYDIAVIGAGHAGIEAALAGARLGCNVIIFTINMDWVANLPCNPSIGGTAKGHLVREIDALGGEMGKAADDTIVQSRMLNRGKGPAVHSLRAQIDRRGYSDRMKYALEGTKGLHLMQAEIMSIHKDGNDWILVDRLKTGYRAKKVIISTGTFLKGRIHIGDVAYEGGPDGIHASNELTDSLVELGIKLKRFKTGTPARVLGSSIDYSKIEAQPGEEPIVPFSFETTKKLKNYKDCYITWTTEKTKDVILANLDRSPMYGGMIDGIGPIYCPSVEDKMVRFADKQRHQVFIEPCGLHTQEMYLQGLSTSLPYDVQLEILKSVPGLENAQIMRPAYAIEYDCCDPLQLESTLEFRNYKGLYGAGQFNGSSGYEEAAGQGLIAGINAVLSIKGEKQIILDRASSYIGTLIDDLVTKGVNDPYRMMTSRSEYRLLLRQDNADQRLTPLGRQIGLVDDVRWQNFSKRQEIKKSERKRLANTNIPPSKELNNLLVSHETSPVTTGANLENLMKRPQLGYDELKPIDTERPEFDDLVKEQIEVEIKYEGYIKRQQETVDEMRKMESRKLPKNIIYNDIKGLRIEARQKLEEVRPDNLGQASRISGVSPADISVLIVWLTTKESRRKDNESS